MTCMRQALGGGALLALLAASPAGAQAAPGATILRSQDVVTWWVVDPASGQAAFFGGDIEAICRGSTSGYDLLAFRQVTDPGAVATALQARGEVRVSVWDPAPRMVWPGLCADIGSRGGPWAAGMAQVNISGRFPVAWGDPDVASPFGLAATGTVTSADGRSLRLQAGYRCTPAGGTVDCLQRLQVR